MPNSESPRRRILAYSGILAVALASWGAIQWWTSRLPDKLDFSEEAARAGGNLPEPAMAPTPRSGPLRIAIGPLGSARESDDATVADLVAAELGKAEGYVVVERRELDRAIRELKLGTDGLLRRDGTLRLGRLVHADVFLIANASGEGAGGPVVARLVDAQSGIIRDLAVLGGAATPLERAARLSAFVRGGGKSDGEAPPNAPVFLSVGGFADETTPRRMDGVEAELRTGLGAALASRGVSLLQRESTAMLHDELRMQRSGWIDSTNPPPRFQTSMWVVDGFWQSVGAQGNEIELALRVRRIGGGVARRTIRAARGDALATAAADATLELMRGVKPWQAATRKGEIQALLDRGADRAGFKDGVRAEFLFDRIQRFNDPFTDQDPALKPNLEAAIESFRSLLLLDPDHSEGRLYLAYCLADPAIHRTEEARSLLAELVTDRSEKIALQASIGFGLTYAVEDEWLRAMAWFRDAKARAAVDWHQRSYQRLIDLAERYVPKESVDTADHFRELETRLFKSIDSLVVASRTNNPRQYELYDGFRKFAEARNSGEYPEVRARILGILPKAVAHAPQMEHAILGQFLTTFPATNNPLLARYDELAVAAAKDPLSVPLANEYFRGLFQHLYYLLDARLTNESVHAAAACRAAEKAGVKLGIEAEGRFMIAASFGWAGQYREALDLMSAVTNPVIAMSSGGRWGRYPSYVTPPNYIAKYRAALGLPEIRDPRRLDVGNDLIIRSNYFNLAPDGDRLWLACCQALEEYFPGTGRLATHPIDTGDDAELTAILQSGDDVWLGTSSGGLLRFDKKSHAVRRFTHSEGLLSDEIAALHRRGDRLWIGHGVVGRRYRSGPKTGGVSMLDIPSGKIVTLMPALNAGTTPDPFKLPPPGAPRIPVTALATTGDDELWVGAWEHGLQRYDRAKDVWSSFQGTVDFGHPTCMAVSDQWVVMGEDRAMRSTEVPGDVLQVVRRSTGAKFRLGTKDGLPLDEVTTMALDGDRLWVGGPSYVAVLDLSMRRTVRYTLMNNINVGTFVIQGDALWSRLQTAIYRIPLAIGRGD
jgi:hypothetical protein